MDALERRKRASEEAAQWWATLQGAGVSRATRQEFADWLRESPIHVAEMLRMAEVHSSLEHFSRWAEVATSGSDNEEPEVSPFPGVWHEPRRPGVMSHRRAWIGAVVVAIGCAASGLTWLLTNFGVEVIHTTSGERREVELRDGSVVDVDPNTRLRIDFETGTRRVSLEQGRALFRVARNPNRPFVVSVNGTLVRAIGTAFGVERREESVVVTVAEGTVAVSRSGLEDTAIPEASPATADEAMPGSPRVQRPVAAKRARAGPVFLRAGQQVTVTPTGAPELVRKVNSSRELAWAQGLLVFDSNSIAEVIEQFNRYNRVQLHVSNPVLARRTVSGVFNASDPESFIAFVQVASPVQVVRNGQDITLH